MVQVVFEPAQEKVVEGVAEKESEQCCSSNMSENCKRDVANVHV